MSTIYFIVTFSNLRFKVTKVLYYNKNYIFNDDHNESDYNRICSQNMDRTMKRFFIVTSIVILSFAIALVGPIYAYIKYGTRSTLLNLRFPFAEKNSDLEFILNLILQIWGGTAGICADIGIEVGYNLYINTIRLTVELIQSDIDVLSSDLEARILTKTQIKHQLLLIFEKIQHTDRYCHIQNEISYE